MILHKLNLANFRAFEQIEIEFERGLNVIAGVNGVGKTAILDAIAVMFSRALPEFTISTARPRSFTEDDISVGKTSMEVSSIYTVGDDRLHAVSQRTTESESGDLFFHMLERYHSAGAPPTEEARQETRPVLHGLKTAANQPIAVLFPPGRLLRGKPQRLHRPDLADKTRAFIGALDEERTVELREFMEWFYAQAELEKQREATEETASQEQIIEALRRVVSEFIPEFSNLRVEYDPKPRFLVDKNGTSLQLGQLSDGERGLLAIVFDITRRLTIANPERADPIREGTGIVLIDEIELHLHPKWQREALRRLSNTFSGCQFIVTTHSPQVLGEVEARSVRYLYRDREDRVQKYTPEQALGMDSNRVLEEIMGAPARNIETQGFLHDLFRAIDREMPSEVQALMDRISQRLGGSDPELVRARSILSFLSGQNEEHHEEP